MGEELWYVKLANGLFAPDTAANRAMPGATVFGNPSDNRLLDVFVDKALGCTPMLGPDVQDAGHLVPSLPTNELQARVHQAAPLALVPANDRWGRHSAARVWPCPSCPPA